MPGWRPPVKGSSAAGNAVSAAGIGCSDAGMGASAGLTVSDGPVDSAKSLVVKIVRSPEKESEEMFRVAANKK